jgi:GDPmannose 4,6-dehydratase
MAIALITGITGQTGSYLAEQLIREGWEVHGVVRDADSARSAFSRRAPEARLHRGDLGDPSRMAELVLTTQPDALFNLGGVSSVAQSWSLPQETATITALGVVALLESAWQLRERTGRRVSFIQASSAEIFGNPSDPVQTEITPVRPINPYGAAKAYAHHLVAVYRSRGLEATSCILYNHESPRRPETFVTRKITKGVAAIAEGSAGELVLGNLDAIRDWGWAPDYADALVRAALSDPDDYVIATGEPRTVGDFVAAAFAAVGIANWQEFVKQDAAFMRPSDAAALVGDSRKAQAKLGWAPKMAFADMVSVMVQSDIAELKSLNERS